LNYTPESYSEIYKHSPKYRCHYTKSLYYPLWLASLKYISGNTIELGCGTGQFTQMFNDNLNLPYIGIDFSDEAISQAQLRNPSMKFVCDDIRSIDMSQYDTIIAFEVLEHIEDDLNILESLKSKQKIVFSVPNYMSRLHYRCFKSKDEINTRYKLLNIHNIEEFQLIGGINTLFLAHGNKK
jgi:2-polyprenyl-3-methyl-5-hydroxy-6-metoxy-1,4-benzoquinol methylase